MEKSFGKSGNITSMGAYLNFKQTAQTQMNTLLEVVQKLSLAKDLETIMYIVRRAARQLAQADGVTFVLRDDNQCFYADEDAIAPLWKGKRFPISQCISGWVMEHRQQVVIEDIYSDDRIPVDAYRPTFVKSLAMTPIRTEAPIGAIGTYWADTFVPTQENLNLLQALADSTSVAIENIQLHTKLAQENLNSSAQIEITRKLMETNRDLDIALQELNWRNQEMQWLRELSSKLQACIYIEEAYKVISQYAQDLLPNVAGIFYTTHPSQNLLESKISWGKPKFEEKSITPEACMGLRQGSCYKVENPERELTCSHYKIESNNRPYTCLPLFAQNDLLGLLYFEWINFDETEKKNNQDLLISAMGDHISIGLSNIKLRETLRLQSK